MKIFPIIYSSFALKISYCSVFTFFCFGVGQIKLENGTSFETEFMCSMLKNFKITSAS